MFAKKWPGIGEKCGRKQKTAKEENEKREKALISKRDEVQQAKVKLYRSKVKAEMEFLEMKLGFYKNAPKNKEMKEKIFEIIEELKPFTEPDPEPEKFSTTQPVTEENYHEQMSEAEVRFEKIKLLQNNFEANRELTIMKFDTMIYKSMTVDVDLLERISNLKIPETTPQDSKSTPTQASESAPTTKDSESAPTQGSKSTPTQKDSESAAATAIFFSTIIFYLVHDVSC